MTGFMHVCIGLLETLFWQLCCFRVTCYYQKSSVWSIISPSLHRMIRVEISKPLTNSRFVYRGARIKLAKPYFCISNI